MGCAIVPLLLTGLSLTALTHDVGSEFVPFSACVEGTVLIRREKGVSGSGVSNAYLNCITAWTKLDGLSFSLHDDFGFSDIKFAPKSDFCFPFPQVLGWMSCVAYYLLFLKGSVIFLVMCLEAQLLHG